jgi:DHA1 family tetracycline resistance protein-like MFS transporter
VLPEIARTRGLADWQLGVVAGAFGFARMAGAMPAGLLADRHVAASLVLSPAFLAVGLVCVTTGTTFSLLVLGRALMGVGHTLLMVGGLTAILRDDKGADASFRLNTFEFSGMLGILGGLLVVGTLPATWSWNLSLAVASSPLIVSALVGRALLRRFPPTPPSRRAAAAARSGAAARGARVFWLMLAAGVTMSFAWSSVSQFLIPLRGTREFGLDRGGISVLLGLAQVVDLLVLLPTGRIADRMGRVPVLATLMLVLGVGAIGTGLGSYPLFVMGCACFGVGLAGWMLPLGIAREHGGAVGLAWRTALYRVGTDAAIFLGPVLSGLLGARAARLFVAAIGLAALTAGARLLLRPLPR